MYCKLNFRTHKIAKVNNIKAKSILERTAIHGPETSRGIEKVADEFNLMKKIIQHKNHSSKKYVIIMIISPKREKSVIKDLFMLTLFIR